MTQVSKRKLAQDLESEVYSVFWRTISKITKDEEINLFFTDLFTKAERVNFAKRLSIAILLNKGYDWEAVRNILKVSPGTIAKISTKINSAGFRIFFKKLERDVNWQKFWEDLAKTYLALTHPEKYARLGSEGIEKLILKKKHSTLH